MSEFIKVAKISDIPVGRSAVIEMGGRTIALFNVNGEFFALDNTCMHRGGPLGEGFVDQNNLTVQCPWHGWVLQPCHRSIADGLDGKSREV